MAKSTKTDVDEPLPTYRLNVALSYPGNRPGKTVRRQAGDHADDIPTKSVPWLIEQGLIEEVAS